MATPDDYGLEFDTRVEHPEHGTLVVEDASGWPVFMRKEGHDISDENGYVELFESEVEEQLDIELE